MQSKTCCFTGHRKIKDNLEEVAKRTERAVTSLIEQGVTDFCDGGALGFDTLAAEIVLDLQTKYPWIRLVLVLPCREQDKLWAEADKRKYRSIIEQADDVVYTSEHYHEGCMYKRNRYLVDNSAFCICYLAESTGGTAYTVNYAKVKGLAVYNVADTAADEVVW